MARYHGKTGVIYCSTSGAGVAKALISLSKWSINRAAGKIDVTAFLDLNKTYVQDLPDVKGALSGFWDSSDDSLFVAAESPDGCRMYLYPSTLYPAAYHYGPAWLDVNIDAAVSGAVLVNGTFVANGSWGRLSH